MVTWVLENCRICQNLDQVSAAFTKYFVSVSSVSLLLISQVRLVYFVTLLFIRIHRDRRIRRMAQTCDFLETKRYAVVTGSNKGIGLEICRQLASKGVTVVLAARDENRGLEAFEKLKESGLSDHVVFLQLDVTDPVSIASLAAFIRTQFGKLDILVNNAAIAGVIMNYDSFARAVERFGDWPVGEQVWDEIITTQTHELAEDCLKTNYYGMKGMVEALAPFLQLSDSARIVNITSYLGLLKVMSNEWAKGVLSDVETLTEERVEEVLNQFLKDFKDGTMTTKGWPTYVGATAYSVSKAAVNAYTRILAKNYPSFCVNCVAPGFVKTDITGNAGYLTAAEGAEYAVRVALLPIGVKGRSLMKY
ncbi:(+)-neomenthol dehydrogenase-like isoform X2 [Durio zibethinus]|uniref:(+)-neomenthol dehydrogenase-like isoform X2 n=1 Tax=Durio zibethinus TaxID=66656 RepID=A0A6P6B048_DURZI|nr:(+)-neomenthol dehydrogenase-like isoform X2 [Durio zibethinus]